MKTQLNISILIIAALLGSSSLMSCSEQQLVAPVAEKAASTVSPIVGNWEWMETVSFAGVRTPQSTGHTIRYSFTNDGSLLRYRDNVLQSKTEFSISSNPTSPTQMHVADEPECIYTVSIENDKLSLTASQEDLGISKFAKSIQ